MKPKLLLYLTSDSNPAKNAIAATLAWATESAGWFFEVYYDAYRLGEHYGGGDPAWQAPGALTGGTMMGAHHHERLYLLLHRFETLALIDGPVAFGPTLEQLDIPRLMVSGFADTYLCAFEVLGLPLPETDIVVDAQPRPDLAGVDAYLYPEIAARSALGLEISAIRADDLSRLATGGLRQIQTLYVGPEGLRKAANLCADGRDDTLANLDMLDPLDALKPDDDFASITERVARRWMGTWGGGWVLADPTAVAAWIPDAWRDRRLAIYSKPQRVIIQRLEDELRARPGRVTTVLGRQYEDADFFLLSSLGLPFQLIDPCRPPFPVLRMAGYNWAGSEAVPLLASGDAGGTPPAPADWKVGGTPPTPADWEVSGTPPASADWEVGGTPPTPADWEVGGTPPASADWEVGGTPPTPADWKVSGTPPASANGEVGGMPPTEGAGRTAGFPTGRGGATGAPEEPPITVRSRGYLPHWEQQGATYFVTFRLADSLPKAVLEEYEAEREAALIRARQEGAILTDEELQRLDWLLSERIQQYLDTGAGRCSLGQPAIAALVANALRHFNGTRYRLFAWCIMPNHVHVVFQPLGDYKLQEILRSWKGFTSKEANRLLGTHGTFWEHEYYDHLIRDEADFRRIVEYVLNNPPKAGLEGWQWVEVYEWPSEAMGAGRSADVLIGRAGSNTALPALADWKVGGTPRPTEADAAFPAPADWKVGGTPPAPVGVPTGVTGITESEPDDDQLRAWAREGRVLVSVIFWTGMIRELENLPRVIDLVALTRMKGGLALTLPALEYQPEGPLELLRIPLDRGGVFPHLELMLASCGLGATIESRMPEGWLAQYLLATNAAFDRLGVPLAWRPKGWWATMDAEMRPLPKPRLPITPKFQAHAPFLQLRYQSPGGQQAPAPASARAVRSAAPPAAARHPGLKRQLGDWVREHGLRAMLAPYRPYEFFAPGPLRKEVIEALRGAGLRYWFSKAGFGRPPTILYQDADVIALNYTVGHWDGWTPFETINSVADLRHAERRLLATKRPGWLVGTLDTCLWAFTGPIWERASGLRAIADFVARGGDSKRLINVTPGVIARYARLLQQ